MKKFILISFMICMISGCSQTTSTHIIEKDFSKEQIIEVDYHQLQEKINQQDDFVLYIGRPDCKDCQEFDPYLKAYLQKNKGVYLYYFNTKKYRDLAKGQNATAQDQEFYDHLYDELEFSWTPTLKFIYHGDFVDTYTYLDEDYYSISDKDKKKRKKQEYIDKLTEWLNNIYVEEK